MLFSSLGFIYPQDACENALYKEAMTRTANEFKFQLARQLGFMTNSCNLYDNGQRDEAIRIATALRVLFHNTSQSTSILAHLGSPSINLISSCVGQPESALPHFHGFGMALQCSDGKRELVPHFDHPPPSSRDVPTWWAEIVWKNSSSPSLISRKEIVLSASNQDGGAHVDAQLRPSYDALSSPGAAGSYVRDVEGKRVVEDAMDAHLMCLRQMGWEVLNSAELIGLST